MNNRATYYTNSGNSTSVEWIRVYSTVIRAELTVLATVEN